MSAQESSAVLFRPQALAASRRRLWGDLLLIRPAGTGTVLGLLALFVVATGCLLWWGEFTRTERVLGYLVPDGGVLLVEAPEAGVVHALEVVEGQQVAAGDVLLEIRDPRELARGGSSAELELGELARELERLEQTRRAELERSAHEERGLEAALARHAARSRVFAVQQELLTRESALAERQAAALAKLGAAGHVSLRQLEAAEQDLLRLAERHQQLAAARLELAGERAHVEERLLNLPGLRGVRLAELEDRRSRLAREQNEIRQRWRFVLRAPAAGRVAALGVEAGESVRPGRTLLTLLAPDARMHAILLVPSRAAGFIEPGQQVRLRYAAFPHARFGSPGGRVVSVSRSILAPAQLEAPARAEEPVYKVRVRPDEDGMRAYGRVLPLQAGMALEADIALERRRLVEWLIDPVLALRGRL